jgi:hypothetical protein
VKRWRMGIARAVWVCMSLFFVMWGIQTAWLGSFPGRDHATYSLWALMQFGAAVVIAVVPVIGWILLKRRNSAKPDV